MASAASQSGALKTISSGRTSTCRWATATIADWSERWRTRFVEVAPASARPPAARRRDGSVSPTRRCTCSSTCPPESGPLANEYTTHSTANVIVLYYNNDDKIIVNELQTTQPDTVKNSSVTTKHLYLILTFRSHHEIFIRRSRDEIETSK